MLLSLKKWAVYPCAETLRLAHPNINNQWLDPAYRHPWELTAQTAWDWFPSNICSNTPWSPEVAILSVRNHDLQLEVSLHIDLIASYECLNLWWAGWCLGISAEDGCGWSYAFLNSFPHLSCCLDSSLCYTLYFIERVVLNTLISKNAFTPTGQNLWGEGLGIHIFIKLHRWFWCSLKLESC